MNHEIFCVNPSQVLHQEYHNFSFCNAYAIVGDNVKGCAIFSLSASIIYIFNDLKDFAPDRIHPLKSSRPIALGSVSFIQTKILIAFFVGVILALCALEKFSAKFITWSLFYATVNVLYSCFLKNFPLIDVTALSSCYVIRLFYGMLGIQLDDVDDAVCFVIYGIWETSK